MSSITTVSPGNFNSSEQITFYFSQRWYENSSKRKWNKDQTDWNQVFVICFSYADDGWQRADVLIKTDLQLNTNRNIWLGLPWLLAQTWKKEGIILSIILPFHSLNKNQIQTIRTKLIPVLFSLFVRKCVFHVKSIRSVAVSQTGLTITQINRSRGFTAEGNKATGGRVGGPRGPGPSLSRSNEVRTDHSCWTMGTW